MRFDVLTVFPGMFSGPLTESILKRAQENGLIEVVVHDLRQYATNRHRSTDDSPFGGGAGMVMLPEPIARALEDVREKVPGRRPRTIALTPAGRRFDQNLARELAGEEWLVLLCGHYEGIDQRALELVDEELSIGDYVLTGGELPAMVVIDAVSRLLPGVLGDAASPVEESFDDGLLEYPHYTRPAVWRGRPVPEVLISGNHAAIARWRRKEALRRTWLRRPDLLAGRELSAEDRKLLAEALAEEEERRPGEREDAPL
ncbi:MAG TPA: tRNA (guanosine(37)-N1)-methyltransferase TrmD [Firmicutes bacterium]|nr:tRNA (guanosine(37)-N1)-methyltransferase TrmD [Bacillota bacterium]